MIGPGPGVPPASPLPDPTAAKVNPDSRRLGFPVVGIGASAGGLHAFQEVLTHLPPDTGMAFVLIPHLDPSHESMMVPILSKSTSMPVREVTEGLAVESNHVYVIPPNATMVLEGGLLRLVPRSQVKHECIDYFMISLANEMSSRAIGVVLSGTASDGTEGCSAIKTEGGLTFAQDEASARFPQMPKNAVAAGCIDMILPPKGIAEELALVSRHPYLRPVPVEPGREPPEDTDIDKTLMSQIFRLLQTSTGVDFAPYKQATIRRRLQRRMALRKSRGLNDYYRFLEENPSEVRALHDEVLINVTSFFRDPEAFDALRERLLTRPMPEAGSDDSLRVWVAGCSTGEEAYSLAIAFLEFLTEKGLSTPLQIFATDISEKAIARARAGIYGAGIRADVSEARLRRFFSPTAGGEFQISKAIRDLCVFARQDLARDPPFSKMDLVSCRNVLIYMAPALQSRVVHSLHYALKPSGWLMLGPSEGIERFPNLFEPLDKKGRIFLKRADRILPRLLLDKAARAPARPRGAVPGPAGVDLEAFDPPREADRLILDEVVPAGVVVNEAGVVVQFRGNTGPFLRPPSGAPSFQLLKLVREELFLDVETALREAREKNRRVRREGISMRIGDRSSTVSVEVLPLPGPADRPRHFVVLFDEPAAVRAEPAASPANAEVREVVRLRDELAASKRYLQSVVDRLETVNEDLRSANEEAVSSNEELLSTNEEIETAKEELQSGNEELNTLNDELQIRNAELGQVNGDWLNLIASVNMAIAIVDRDLKFRRFTPPAEHLLNVIPGDVGRRITDFKNNLKVPNLDGLIRRVLETLETTEQEVEDDRGRWYSMRIRPYKTLDDKIAGAVIVWVDIHGLKLAMGQLERTHALTDGIVETIRDPLLVLDSEFRVKKTNRAFLEFFRTTPEDTVGRLVFDLGNRQWDMPAVKGLLDSLAAGESPAADLEVAPDFDVIGPKTMLVSARRLRFSAPEEQLYLMALEDVTERTMRERFTRASALVSQTLNLDALLEAVAQLAARHIGDWASVHVVEDGGSVRRRGLAHRDPDKLPAIRELLDRYPAELERSLAGANTLSTGRPDLAPEIRDTDLQAAARDAEHLRLLRALNVTSSMSVPLAVRGGAFGALSLFTTGSRRRFGPDDLAVAEELAVRISLALDNARQYRRAQEAVRERERFISIASHEFKTPLSVLLLESERLLLQGRNRKTAAPLPTGVLESLEKVKRQADRLVDLVNNLLDVSSLVSGKLQLHPGEMDLRESVESVAARLRESPAGRGAVISIDGDRPVRGRWDRLRLEQVITNLITNGIKYGDGKPVEVLVRDLGSVVLMQVGDHGIGIPPEAKERLFRPYERFAPQSSSGLGLGLFIVRQIIDAHGGSIRVQSELGKGTTFAVELPRPRDPSPGAEAGAGDKQGR